MLRKFQQRAQPVAPRFNEAEARAPRMRGLGWSFRRPCFAASMRPRRVRLGCAALDSTYLSVNPRFNEAEARAPRMPSAPLQAHRECRRFNEAEARAPRMPHIWL